MAVARDDTGWNMLTMSGTPRGGKFCVDQTENTWEKLCEAACVLGHNSMLTSFVQKIPPSCPFTLDIDISRNGYDDFFISFGTESAQGLDNSCVLSFILEELEKLLVARGLDPSVYLRATVLSAHGRTNALSYKTSWRIFFYKLIFSREDNRVLTELVRQLCKKRFGNHALDFDEVIDANFGRAGTGTRAPYSHKIKRELCSSCKALRNQNHTRLPKNLRTCAFSTKCGRVVVKRPFVPAMVLSHERKAQGWVCPESRTWKEFVSRCSVWPFHGETVLEPLVTASGREEKGLPRRGSGSQILSARRAPACRGNGNRAPKKRKVGGGAWRKRSVLELKWSPTEAWEKKWSSLDEPGNDLASSAGARVALLLDPILGLPNTSARVVSHKLEVNSYREKGTGRVVRMWQGLTKSRTAGCPMNNGAPHTSSRLSFNIYENGRVHVRCFMEKCDHTQAVCKIPHEGVKHWLRQSLSSTK